MGDNWVTMEVKNVAKGSISPGKLYQRRTSLIWCFKYTDSSGKRSQKSTGTTDKKRAEEFQRTFLEQMGRNRPIYAKPYTFREVVSQYLKVETNPRYIESKVTQKNYSDSHAKDVGVKAKMLTEIVDKHIPGLMDEYISNITRRDVKNIAAAIVTEIGNCRTAQQIFINCKTFFKQAVADDMILASPGEGISNIGYKEVPTIAIHEELITWMINERRLFPSTEFWAFITVAATTGMRRGEVAAIAKSRLHGNLLTIDRQIKSNSLSISKPKGGFVRTIPLSKIAMEALSEIDPKDGEFYFPLSRNWIVEQLGKLKAALKAVDQENLAVWSKLTPHVLRRSVNTNLLIYGASQHLVAEYMSWKHQNQNIDTMIPMQRRYFKIKSTNLQPIADMIDVIYSLETKKAKVFDLNNA